MAATSIKNLSRCLDFRIYCILRRMKWYIQRNDVDLKAVSGVPKTFQSAVDNHGFCWLSDYDDQTPPTVTRNQVTVKAGGQTVAQNLYTINFIDSTITFTGSVPAGKLTVSALYWGARVIQGYPDPERLELIDLPSIAWDIDGVHDTPYGIGTSSVFRDTYCTVDILATNRGQRMDLLEDLQTFIKVIPMINMDDHQPLLPSGQIDPAFSFADQQDGIVPQLKKPNGSMIPPRQGGSDKEKFRAFISLETQVVV